MQCASLYSFPMLHLEAFVSELKKMMAIATKLTSKPLWYCMCVELGTFLANCDPFFSRLQYC